MGVHKFRELKVWQRSIAYVARTYKVSAGFPSAEQFGLTSQLRRAATTIPLNIAEGSGSGTDAEFRRFLRIAFRSTYEVMTILEVAHTLGLVDDDIRMEMVTEADEIAAMLYGLIKKIGANF
jgi:four helix bundle protein